MLVLITSKKENSLQKSRKLLVRNKDILDKLKIYFNGSFEIKKCNDLCKNNYIKVKYYCVILTWKSQEFNSKLKCAKNNTSLVQLGEFCMQKSKTRTWKINLGENKHMNVCV